MVLKVISWLVGLHYVISYFIYLGNLPPAASVNACRVLLGFYSASLRNSSERKVRTPEFHHLKNFDQELNIFLKHSNEHMF